jgi:hypothetical protein
MTHFFKDKNMSFNISLGINYLPVQYTNVILHLLVFLKKVF